MDITIGEDLWVTRLLREGLLERWLVPDGAKVEAGDRIAEIRIEDALREILAPAGGRLAISAGLYDVLVPGSILGHIVAL